MRAPLDTLHTELGDLANSLVTMKGGEEFDEGCATIAAKLKELIERGSTVPDEKLRIELFLMVVLRTELYVGSSVNAAWRFYTTFRTVGNGQTELRRNARENCRMIVRACAQFKGSKFPGSPISNIIAAIHKPQ